MSKNNHTQDIDGAGRAKISNALGILNFSCADSNKAKALF
jgi:hypothetical protein